MEFSFKTRASLEFDKILEMAAKSAPTKGGAEAVRALSPCDDIVQINRRLKKTSDAKRLIGVKGMPPFGDVTDVTDSVARAEKGAVLTTTDLLSIARLLTVSRQLIDYIRVDKLFDTCLDEIFLRLTQNRFLEEKIKRAIISEDMIADEASAELAEIRRKIRSENNRIKDELQKFISGGAYSKYLQENIVTMRNGRYVIPVKAECKNEIKGFIHDTSSSGATVFIEPVGVLESNNAIKVLEGREEREIERILAELSADCGNSGSMLTLNYFNITELSLAFACAELSFEMKANEPKVVQEREFSLERARHPLLNKDTAVPINVSAGRDYDTIVITGPNTGGKTVTLKTIGLLVLMAQCGLHIPASETSVIGVFDKVLVDIGDEQSIEQSLSTFSAHMVNIVSMMKALTPKTLVLFDELGAGTDPIEGAALASAILETAKEKGALTIATTHYAELKAYALENERVCNAACEFDIETLKPTYKLIMGAPGKSNAFAIAGKLGLDDEILKRAASLIKNDEKRFEHVIEKLEASRMESERNREITSKARAEFEEFRKDAEEQIKEAKAKAEAELESARRKARQTIEGARISAEYILNDLDKIRKRKAEELSAQEIAEAKRAARERAGQSAGLYAELEDENEAEYVPPRPYKKGDEVKLKLLGRNGILLDAPDKKGNVKIQTGRVTTTANVRDIRLIEKESEKNKAKKPGIELKVKADRMISPELDLRGQLADDAWLMTDKYIDEAMIAGLRSVRIIHGKGTGALKRHLWSYFVTDKRLESYRLGAYGEGDSGVTVLELKD